MVNTVEWLWDPSDSFVICFCEPEGPQRSIAFQYFFILLTPVVQTLDSAIHRINHYPADSVIGFPNTYRLDSDLSGG